MTVRSIHDVVAFLATTVRAAESGARPLGFGVFPLAYHSFTLELISRLTAGGFRDPVWVSDFIVRFAARYELALSDPSAAVLPWRTAFDSAHEGPRPTIRHLLLGINAHMSYDLCAVLVDLLAADTPADRERDVVGINDVIESGIGPVQRAIYARFRDHTGLLDAFGLGIDELVTWLTFTRWRGDAWTDALAILDGRRTLADVERRVHTRARLLRYVAL